MDGMEMFPPLKQGLVIMMGIVWFIIVMVCIEDMTMQALKASLLIMVGIVWFMVAMVHILLRLHWNGWSIRELLVAGGQAVCTGAVLAPVGALLVVLYMVFLPFAAIVMNCLAANNAAARRDKIMALVRLRRHPYKGWQERGWLILIRARYKRYLVREDEGCSMMTSIGELSGLEYWCYKSLRRYPAVLADSSEDTKRSGFSACGEKASDEELQLLNRARSSSSLAWAVVTTVEIEEEGLFRNIVTYL